MPRSAALLALLALLALAGCDLYDAVEGYTTAPLSPAAAEVDTVFTTGGCGSVPVAVAAGAVFQVDDRMAVRQSRLSFVNLSDRTGGARPWASGDTVAVELTAFVVLSGRPSRGDGVPVVGTRLLLPEQVPLGVYTANYFRDGQTVLQPFRVGCDT